MNRKHLTLILLVAVVTSVIAACDEDDGRIPNPGFAILSTFMTRAGVESSLPAAMTRGSIAQPLFGAPISTGDATGTKQRLKKQRTFLGERGYLTEWHRRYGA